MSKKENWISVWHREDKYGPADGRITCEKCGSSQGYSEGGHFALRCGMHRNCLVRKDHSCSKAAG